MNVHSCEERFYQFMKSIVITCWVSVAIVATN